MEQSQERCTLSGMRNSAFIKQPKGNLFSVTPRRLYFLGAFLFLSLITAYISIGFIPFLFSPEIVLVNPSGENVIVNSKDVLVSGRVKNTHSLTLNGKELYIRENGIFEEQVNLREGINAIAFRAQNIFGRSTQLVKNVVYIKN